MIINHTLYKCDINREMTIDYIYTFEPSNERFKPTIVQNPNGSINIQSYFGIRIKEGYQQNSIWITTKQYFTFVSLLKKAVTLITDNLFKLYPNIGSATLSVDQVVLERFQNERSLYSNNITMKPCVWIDKTDQPYAAIEIETVGNSVKIPFEDAIGIVEMFQCFDPFSFGLGLLRILGKIE